LQIKFKQISWKKKFLNEFFVRKLNFLNFLTYFKFFRTFLLLFFHFLISLTFTTSLHISCDFTTQAYQNLDRVYECEVKSALTITTKGVKITDSPSTHSSEYSNEDVTAFSAKLKTIFYFPRGLDEIFKNLLAIKIGQCQLKEIRRENFEKFTQLRWLSLSNNDLSVIESGIFDSNLNLEFISLRFNKIKHIDSNVFEGLKNLQKLWLELNACVNKNANNKFEVIALSEEIKEVCLSNEMLKNYLEICEKKNSNLSLAIEEKNLKILELEDEILRLKNLMG
jgi:Leucine-rich repeat (LRR) protein